MIFEFNNGTVKATIDNGVAVFEDLQSRVRRVATFSNPAVGKVLLYVWRATSKSYPDANFCRWNFESQVLGVSWSDQD